MRWSAPIFFELKWKHNVSSVKIIFTNLMGGQYLFEILHTSTTMRTSKNAVKSGYFQKLQRWRVLFLNEGGV